MHLLASTMTMQPRRSTSFLLRDVADVKQPTQDAVLPVGPLSGSGKLLRRNFLCMFTHDTRSVARNAECRCCIRAIAADRPTEVTIEHTITILLFGSFYAIPAGLISRAVRKLLPGPGLAKGSTLDG